MSRSLGQHDESLSHTLAFCSALRPNGAGGARGASRSGSASVTTMLALFTREVECKMASVRLRSLMTIAHVTRSA
jgi:hypothetical protein